jgi:hypothetical protein
MRRSGVPEVPEVPGVLTETEVLATAEHIAERQEPGGAISWPDGHTDAWDHVECAMALSVCGLSGPARRAYDWLRRTQRADGSWPKRTEAGIVTDAAAESNQTAYVAVGTWHEFQLTGDTAFLAQMWPVVRRAIGFVLELQLPRGEIVWQRTADGTPARYALLTGCSSTYQSLLCAARLARLAGEPQPRWERAARQLGHVVASHPGAFADKSRFSMDWYYPVLAGPVRGAAGRDRLDSGWAEFVVPGLGCAASGTSRGSPGQKPASSSWRSTPSGTGTGRWLCSGRSSTCGTPTAVTGPAGSTRTRRTSRTNGAAGPRRR